MKFKFGKLQIWQKAMEFGERINILSDKFPEKENLFELEAEAYHQMNMMVSFKRKI